jgi:hypothetical protein
LFCSLHNTNGKTRFVCATLRAFFWKFLRNFFAVFGENFSDGDFSAILAPGERWRPSPIGRPDWGTVALTALAAEDTTAERQAGQEKRE